MVEHPSLRQIHKGSVNCLQARKNAEAVELAMRLDRLQAQAGASMVTTNTLASMDEDESDAALKRFNIILKVCDEQQLYLIHVSALILCLSSYSAQAYPNLDICVLASSTALTCPACVPPRTMRVLL